MVLVLSIHSHCYYTHRSLALITVNVMNSHPGGAVPSTGSDRGNNLSPIRGLLWLEFTGSTAKSHSGQTGCTDCWEGKARFLLSEESWSKKLVLFQTVFPMELGVGRVGVGSAFLVLGIFQRWKLKHKSLRAISETSEELHVLLISIKTHTRLL